MSTYYIWQTSYATSFAQKQLRPSDPEAKIVHKFQARDDNAAERYYKQWTDLQVIYYAAKVGACGLGGMLLMAIISVLAG